MSNYTNQAPTTKGPDSVVEDINRRLSDILEFEYRLNSALTVHVESLLGRSDAPARSTDQPREVPNNTGSFVRMINEETVRTAGLIGLLGLSL